MNKKNSSSLLVLLLFILYFQNKSNAQSTRIINVDEAIDMALQNNGVIQAKALEIKAAQSLKKTVGEIPKLELSSQFGQYNSIEFDNGFHLEQNIPFPTIFSTKKSLVNEEIKGREIQQNISVNEVKMQVRTYFYQILYLQNKDKQLRELDSLYNDFLNAAQLRYRTGDITKVEVTTAEAQKGKMTLQLKQNEVLLNNATQNLSAILNTAQTFIIDNQAPYLPLQLSAIPDSASLARHPYIASLFQEAIIAEKNKKVARAQALPDFTLGYTNQSLIGFQTIKGNEQYYSAANRFHAGNIGITIPLAYSATAAKIKSLDFQKQAATMNMEQVQKQLSVQLQNTLLQYRQDLMQYDYFQQQALPNAKEIIDAAQTAFRTGGISYIEYLYALETASEIKLNYLKSIDQINQTIINIYSLTNQ